MNRCKDCKHWSPAGDIIETPVVGKYYENRGRCGELENGSDIMTEDAGSPEMWTKADFGCVRWEAREA